MSCYGFRIMQGRITIEKDPDAVLVYGFELARWLAGEALVELEVIGNGITVEQTAIDGTRALARISGGTVGEEASATFRFTTESGATDVRTMWFLVGER